MFDSEAKIAPDDLFFLPVYEGKDLDITIYGHGFSKIKKPLLKKSGDKMLSDLLEGNDHSFRVRKFVFRDMDRASDITKLRKLSQLPGFLDNYTTRA